VLAEDVRRYAEDPAAWGPDLPPESGLTRILTERYCLLLGPVPTFTSISRLRIDPDDVAEVIAEIRAHVAERGHREAMWWVGSSAAPGDLADRLQAHGLVPDNRPGSEPHGTSMVLVTEPPETPGVEARRVESLEEFRIATSLTSVTFGAAPEEAAAWKEIAAERYDAERAGHAPRTYLAFAEGQPVGVARALFDRGSPAVLMIGGGVLQAARGRGVYRALVRARWDDAVAASTPALCTQAGAMSRPILEGLGFQPVAEHEILLDPTT
jgi:GNAT superfamily N-acetyltransferase